MVKELRCLGLLFRLHVADSSVISEAAASTDVPTITFNLGFVLSLSDKETEFTPDDSTADMFM